MTRPASKLTLTCVALALIAGASTAPRSLSAQTYDLSAVALVGDDAPDTGGGTYTAAFGQFPVRNDAGSVAFVGAVAGGSTSQGIFVAHPTGASEAIALVGDPAPDTGGGTYQALGDTSSINTTGQVAFLASITGGTATQGIFLHTSSGDEAVVRVGDPAPGTGGGTYDALVTPSLNDLGEVAFQASIAGGAVSGGIFLASTGGVVPLALTGDPAPDTGGGTYASFAGTHLTDAGEAVFVAQVSGGSGGFGVFVAAAGGDRAAALTGETAPVAGGTYSNFASGPPPTIDDTGRVAFIATIAGGSVTQASYVDEGGPDRAIALPGDPAPGTGSSYDFPGAPIASANGHVAFYTFYGGGSGPGVFVDRNGSDAAVALDGQSAPGTSGGSFSTFNLPSIDANGDLAFFSHLSGGSASQGIFRANRPSVPFSGESVLFSGATGVRSLAAADVDRDGDLDALSAGAGTIHFFENDGSSPPIWAGTPIFSGGAGEASSVELGDVDGDGDLDLLVGSVSANEVTWHENDGASPPGWEEHVISSGELTWPRFVVGADLDRDGDLDAVAATANALELAWFENDGLSPPGFTTRTIATSTASVYSVFVADVDADGDPDLLAASFNDDTIAWYENDGASPPGFTARTIATSADGASSVAAADVDGDGDLDALSVSATDGRVAWYESDGATPPAWTEHTIAADLPNGSSVATADVDGDGDVDVLATSVNEDRVAWYENGGGAAPVWTRHTLGTSADGAAAVLAADFDADGDLDVLSASQSDGKVAWYENQTIHRSAVFPERQEIAAEYGSASLVLPADVDRDGWLDAVSYSPADGTLDWQRNLNGDGTSWSETGVTGSFPDLRGLDAADLDGDGDLDLVSADASADSVSWHENTDGAGGSWSDHVLTSSENLAQAVAIADVDGDGAPDIVFAAGGDDRVGWLRNTDGAGSFGSVQTISALVTGATDVVAIDVDRDGDLDVFSAASGGTQVYWHENTDGAGTSWADHAIDATLTAPSALAAGDLNGDGRPDLVALSQSGDAIHWYERPLLTTLENRSQADAIPIPVFDPGLGQLVSAQLDYTFSQNGMSPGGDHAHTHGSVPWGGATSLASHSHQVVVPSVCSTGDSPCTGLLVPGFSMSSANSVDHGHSVCVFCIITSTDGNHAHSVGSEGRTAFYAGSRVAPFLAASDFAISAANLEAVDAGGHDHTFCAFNECLTNPDGSFGGHTVFPQWSTTTTFTYEPTDGWTRHTVDVGTIAGPFDVAVADLDADGDLDLAVSYDAEARIAWYENTAGDGSSWTTHVFDDDSFENRQVALADVDRDGAVDVLVATSRQDRVAWYRNRGGQLSLPTSDLPGSVFFDAEPVPLLRIDAGHEGRAGDSDVEVATIELRLEDGAGNPLDPTQANDLIAALRLHLDEGNQSWDGTENLVVELTALSPSDGVVSFLVDELPDVQLSPGGQASYFVVAELAADASAQSPNRFRVTHRLASTSTGEDAGAELPLRLEGADDVDSQVVAALSALGDEDGDGVDNGSERDTHGTDPLLADSDGDGLGDAAELAGSTDPLDPDSDADGWLDGTEVALGTDPDDDAQQPAVPLGAPFVERLPVVSTGVDGASWVQVADVDRDGDADLLSAGSGGGAIAWHENTAGDGSAWSAIAIASLGAGPVRVAVGDVDGDGDADAISAAHDLDTIAWHENASGDGSSWTPASALDAGAAGALSAQPVDLDRDGDLDLLGASFWDDEVAWYENTGGDGSAWTRHEITGREEGASHAFAADVDGDGDPDVVSAGSADLAVTWHENAGGDGLSWTSHPIATAAAGERSVFPADLDGDGDVDVLSGQQDDRIVWYENLLGDGSAWAPVVVSVSDAAGDVLALDTDEDGDLDVIAGPSSQTGLFALYENLGDGHLWAPRGVTASLTAAHPTAGADVDGDGDVDLLSTSQDDDSLAWYENRTIRRSAALADGQHLVTGTALVPVSVFPADIDGDGDPDALVATSTDGKLAWHESDGGSPPGFGEHVIATGVSFPDTAVAADLDGDGDLDALLAGSSQLAWYESDGGSPPGFTQRVIAASAARSAEARDLDGDGDLDVLAVAPAADEIQWYESDGGSPPGFTQRTVSATVSGPEAVVAADLDRDGDLDVLSGSSATLDWHENDGGSPPGFSDHNLASGSPGGGRSVFAVDLDGDGDLDALASEVISGIEWYENTDGAGSFAAGVAIEPDPIGVRRVLAADLDADGDADVLTGSDLGDRLAWYENTDGLGSFVAHRIAPPETGLASIFLSLLPVDLDGDGDLDLLANHETGDAVHWFENRGGQFALPTRDEAYLGMVEGRTRQVLEIGGVNRGRSGDSDAEIATIELLLEASPGVPLADAEADALISELAIHLDDGSGAFDGAPTDAKIASVTSFSLSAGLLTIPFADLLPAVQLAPATPRTYFVAVTLQPTAAAALPDQFELSHLTQSSSTGEDASFDLPLALEFQLDQSTGPVTALPPVGDADGDSLSNADEADLHDTDPLLTDTDGDGLSDADEVLVHGTDPTGSDSDGDGLDDGTEVAVTVTDPLDADHDDDGFCDGPGDGGGSCTPGDNCPAVSNVSQTNSDPLPAGDACQCGDVNGDFVVDDTDRKRARENLLGATLTGTFVLERCNVADVPDRAADCEVRDIALLDRFVRGASVTLHDVCDAYVGP